MVRSLRELRVIGVLVFCHREVLRTQRIFPEKNESKRQRWQHVSKRVDTAVTSRVTLGCVYQYQLDQQSLPKDRLETVSLSGHPKCSLKNK